MGALAPLVGIAGSLLGGLFGGQPKTTNFSGSTSGVSGGTGTNTFNYDPNQSALRNAILQSGTQQLTGAPADLSGIQSLMLQNTNAGFGDAEKVLRQTLAARGLTYSPMAAGAENQLQTQRVGAGINVMNQMPLLREQLYQQRLANALNAFRGVPISQTMTQSGYNRGTTQGTETQTNPGGMLGGLFGNLGQTAPMFGDLSNLFGGSSAPTFTPPSPGFNTGVTIPPIGNVIPPPPPINMFGGA